MLPLNTCFSKNNALSLIPTYPSSNCLPLNNLLHLCNFQTENVVIKTYAKKKIFTWHFIVIYSAFLLWCITSILRQALFSRLGKRRGTTHKLHETPAYGSLAMQHGRRWLQAAQLPDQSQPRSRQPAAAALAGTFPSRAVVLSPVKITTVNCSCVECYWATTS